jgi:hypothetical protein
MAAEEIGELMQAKRRMFSTRYEEDGCPPQYQLEKENNIRRRGKCRIKETEPGNSKEEVK